MQDNYGLKKLDWISIRKHVKVINPELTQIIDEISPDKTFSLFKVSYPYGSNIMKNGVLQLPNKSGKIVSISDISIPVSVKKDLGYNLNSNPVSLLLKKTAEIFFILENHTIPLYGLIRPGKIFGTWNVLGITQLHGPAFLWSMTAGARSIFMLPKVSENGRHSRLCKHYNLKVSKPESLLDQWFTFKQIINSTKFDETWHTEILFFGKKWFDKLFDSKFIYFQRYLYTQAWEGSNYFRHQFIWSLIFSLIKKRKHLKYDPYIANTVEHLLSIGLGVMPGFKVSDNNDAAPIKKLQEAYINIYRLRKYTPIMFQPHNLDMYNNNDIVYYSLEYPTTIHFSPRSTNVANKLNDLIYIEIVLEQYLSEIKNGELNIEHTSLSKLSDLISYSYFHNKDNCYDIMPCKEIYHQDKLIQKQTSFDKFAHNSPFLQGCVMIKKR